jgi:hypothetical protein
MDTFMQNSSSTFGQLEGQKIGIKYVLKYFGKKIKSIKFLVIFPILGLQRSKYVIFFQFLLM